MQETYDSLSIKIGQIVGSSNEECKSLYDCVFDVKDLTGEIVEIGCLYGKTTSAILLAAKELNEQVTCVDYFFQYPDLNTCTVINKSYPSKETAEDAFSKSTYLEFAKNLINLEIYDNALIIASKSKNLAKVWAKPIKFLFIDADHSYAGAKQDFDLFEPFVVQGGIIAMHDVDNVGHPGVVRLYSEILDSGRFTEFYDRNKFSCKVLRKK